MPLEPIVEKAWDGRDSLSAATQGEVRDAVMQAVAQLDTGAVRVAEKQGGEWKVNQWLKKALLLFFRLHDMEVIESGAVFNGHHVRWFDKIPLKFAGWDEHHFRRAGFRAVPGCIVRKSAFIGRDVVLMPSFVNVGAHVGEGTMVDTWATIGSCAQIGRHCHISGGVGIGGVLEPLQAAPVIIEDNCFIGARSEIAEGVIVEEGAVISMGVYIGASTKIVDRETGKIYQGRVPAYSVVVPGTLSSPRRGEVGRGASSGDATINISQASPHPNPPPMGEGTLLSTYCAVIVKKVDEKTRSKTSINELLRT